MTATGANCDWTSQSTGSWFQINPAGGGAGTFTVNYTIFPNFSKVVRTAVMRLGNTQVSAAQSASARNDNDRFVQLLYFSFFGRLPSEPELAFQVGSGLSRATLVNNFFTSGEFNLGGRFVAGLYVGVLNRDAEYGGWLFQRNALSTGVVDRTGDGPKPPGLSGLIPNFLGSPEFALRNGTLTDEDYVRLLYLQILLRPAAQAEVDFQAGALKKGTTRVRLADNFLSSQEFQNGTGPRLTTFLLYACLLQRDPTEAERNAMIGRIQTGTPLATLIQEILSSAEFGTVVN